MTRLEPAGEPSMEDILASIRKIIAEDPPGSRALPEVRAEPAAPSVTDRIFQRMGETARSEPAKPAAATEPYLRSSMPSLSSTPSPSNAAGTKVADAFDIDAQMAEVLSKTRGAAPRRDVEPSFDPVVPEVQAALDSLSYAPSLPASSAPQPRPGFTVARDGFVPDAPAKTPLNGQSNAPGSDPFEFSLGPSPFAARSAPKPALDTSMPEVRDTRFQDFGAFVPTRPLTENAALVETPVAAKANDASPVEAAAADAPVAESAETKPTEATSSSAPTAEVIAAQLKDFDAAIKSPEAEPVAALESVDKVLAELKAKLDQASAPENDTALVSVPDPVTAAALAEAEAPESVPAPQDPIGLAVPEPEAEQEPVALAAAEPEATGKDITATTFTDVPATDIVSITEPAPIAAPEAVREIERDLGQLTAQEIVVTEHVRTTPSAHSTSPFHTMQASAMPDSGVPGARSMEDTVAELLRPMLRSWLAENMPKIVERALRKEIDDSLHSEHKTAAE